MEEKKNIRIIHWNCNHLLSKLELFKNFLNTFSPDIVLLNEIKLDLETSNFYLNFSNYSTISKQRNRFGVE